MVNASAIPDLSLEVRYLNACQYAVKQNLLEMKDIAQLRIPHFTPYHFRLEPLNATRLVSNTAKYSF